MLINLDQLRLRGRMPIAKRSRMDRWVRCAERKRLRRDFAGVVKCVSTAALAGITEAQFYLADLYQGGVGVPRSLGSSVFWLEQAALGGHLEAMVRLAKLELIGFAPAKAIFGGNGPPNHVRSRMWAERAAAAGLPEGKAVLALILEHSGAGSQTEIRRLLEESAAAEDPSACLQLAIKLLKDHGSNCDRARVASLISCAAKKELPQALYLSGLIKNLGFGCTRNDDHAHTLYERSASRGSIYGMARHGAALIAGKQGNLVTGETWLRKAALAGHGAAASMIGALRAGQDGLPPNFREAFAWFQKAESLNDPFGVKAAALLSYLGYGESSKTEVILALLSKSRQLAIRPALDPASLLVAAGVPFAFTIRASEWFTSQAQAGERQATLGLASCLAFGMEGPSDHAATLRCLQHA